MLTKDREALVTWSQICGQRLDKHLHCLSTLNSGSQTYCDPTIVPASLLLAGADKPAGSNLAAHTLLAGQPVTAGRVLVKQDQGPLVTVWLPQFEGMELLNQP